jgi:hypothetical protein
MQEIIKIEDRATRPMPTVDPIRKNGDEEGPSTPDVDRPAPRSIMDRMKKIDPDTAKKYRQRSGE